MNTLARLGMYLAWLIAYIWFLLIPAVLWLAYGAWRASHPSRGATLGHVPRSLWFMLLGPVVVLAYGAVAYRWEAGSARWPGWLLNSLVSAAGFGAIWLAARHRAAARYAVPLVLATLAALAAAWFISSMSIVDDWV